MIEIHIINILSLLCLLHFSNSYLSIYLKTKQKKTAKQISKQDKTKKEKKKEEGKKTILSRIWTQYLRLDPTSHSHYAIEDGHVTWPKVSHFYSFSMELPPANDRAIKTTRSNGMKLRLIETRLLTVKNNVNAFHGNERTYAIKKPTQLLREVGRKTLAYVFLSRFPLLL